jgi:hypothetical protein
VVGVFHLGLRQGGSEGNAPVHGFFTSVHEALLDEVGVKYNWVSTVTEGQGSYPPLLKCKIWVTGERSATIRNEAGQAIPMPTQPWPRPRANALLEARGVYRMANGTAGLILQVAALHLADQTFGTAPDPFSMET